MAGHRLFVVVTVRRSGKMNVSGEHRTQVLFSAIFVILRYFLVVDSSRVMGLHCQAVSPD